MLVEDARTTQKRDIVITGCIDLSSIEVDPNYFLTKVYDPNEDERLSDSI